MKLLVTGGAGYIGSVVTQHLLEAGHRTTVLDDLSTGHRDAVPPDADFVEADIVQAGATLHGSGFDGVLHFAAKSLVGESMACPEMYWRNNVAGSLALLEAVQQAGVPRFVFSSTAATYGQPEQSPITEDAPTRPTNPYGACKLAVDHMLTSFAAAHSLAAVSLRYFNVAGAYGRYGERHVVETHLIPNALKAASGKGPALSLFGDDYPTPDGTCVRDYIHVADLARAHLLALGIAQPGTHTICNLGNGDGYSVLQVVRAVEQATGRPVPAIRAPRRAGDPASLVASNARALELLGWRPTLNLDAMVRDSWEFSRTTG